VEKKLSNQIQETGTRTKQQNRRLGKQVVRSNKKLIHVCSDGELP